MSPNSSMRKKARVSKEFRAKRNGKVDENREIDEKDVTKYPDKSEQNDSSSWSSKTVPLDNSSVAKSTTNLVGNTSDGTLEEFYLTKIKIYSDEFSRIIQTIRTSQMNIFSKLGRFAGELEQKINNVQIKTKQLNQSLLERESSSKHTSPPSIVCADFICISLDSDTNSGHSDQGFNLEVVDSKGGSINPSEIGLISKSGMPQASTTYNAIETNTEQNNWSEKYELIKDQFKTIQSQLETVMRENEVLRGENNALKEEYELKEMDVFINLSEKRELKKNIQELEAKLKYYRTL